MVIEFYAGFGKRLNSTKLPGSGVTVRTLTGYLREPTSIMNPVIKIERLPNDGTPTIYTYAYVPSFYRYYFVRDWRWVDGLWECDMEEDVLASFKTEIGNCNEYILRTDSTGNALNFNGAISDKMYPATTTYDVDQTALRNPFLDVISDGTYVIGVISGEASQSVGAISYFAMTSGQFGALKAILFSNNNLDIMGLLDPQTAQWAMTEMSEQIFRTMYNPFQYIVSCMWFPIQPSDFVGYARSSIRIGWWDYSDPDFPTLGKLLSQQVITMHDGIEQFPLHPQSLTRGSYLNHSPYTKRTLYGKFGSMVLDTSLLKDGDYCVCTYDVDVITGKCIFRAFRSLSSDGANRKLLGKTEFLLGVPIQLAQVGVDYLGTAVHAIDAVRSAGIGALIGGATGGTAGAIAGGLITGAHGIYDTIDSAMPQMMTSGTNGSFAGVYVSTTLISVFFQITEENIEHKGRPLCEHRVINTLSGFIQCSEGDVNFSCFSAEKTRIGQFFTEGFFWE